MCVYSSDEFVRKQRIEQPNRVYEVKAIVEKNRAEWLVYYLHIIACAVALSNNRHTSYG